jgi:hypothetical protein
MTPAELAAMKRQIIEGWPNQDFTPTLFDVWADSLHKFPWPDVEQAIKMAIASDRFRPPVAEVVESLYAGPTGLEVASMAWRAIGRYGYHSEERARAALPSVVWDAIESFGGWYRWCTSEDAPATRERMAKIADGWVRRAARSGHLAEIQSGGGMVFPAIGMRVDDEV